MRQIVGINSNEVSSNVIFYSNDISIYKKDRNIVLYNNKGEILSVSSAPIDSDRYEVIDLIDSVLIVFSGKSITIVDKLGGTHISYQLDPIRIGRCITKPLFCDRNHIILGTKVKDRVQFVNYNFMSQSRDSQTTSWKVFGISSATLLDKKIFGILDDSLLVCCNAETGENLWSRFEAAKIQKGIFWHKNKILYTVQGLLRSVWMSEVQNTVIPSVRLSSLEHIDGNILYATSKEGSAICSIDLNENKILWETNTKFIVETCFVPVKYENEVTNCIIARTTESIIFINASNGMMLHSIRVSNASQMRFTENFLLVNHTDGTIIIGER